MTDNQKQFVNGLEGLVHKRFNRKSLERAIRNLLPPRTPVKFGWDIQQLSADYDMLFEVRRNDDLYGFFDVYYLPMNRKACLELGEKERFYVTEIGYEFGV